MKSLTQVISESLFESEHLKGPHGIFEMSQVSHKIDQLPNNTQIWVYGENDLQGTKPPHFHIMVDNRFEFEVTFDHFHDLQIWRSKTVKHDWSNYSNVKKALKKWLDQENVNMKGKTNAEAILIYWNANNSNNEVDQDKYINLYKKLKSK